ncbi:protein rep [Gemelliphila palaticanis]|uniref:Protein rep n=1 Tax=Gemelliphila palaticanis TaxID=81950 RepID=A0ABX2T0K5_9BACL|nr:protein rep [Gemella palaticanis]MBF0716225.1 protein rep [Gemella palaticanis]NYS48155.1 protein rep [Gemella palaticanis]
MDNNKIKMSKKTLININHCGSWLQFLADKNLEKHKLYQGNFCTNRFCPICSKKKAIKDAVELKIITEYVTKELKRQYIFVTFTAPNVIGKNLSEEIDKYNKAFNHFIKLKKYKNVIKGYIRKLEVTYNNNKKSKSYDTYHPHFHVLISVDISYFKGGIYIKRDEWLKDWQDVMQDKTITQVDVRRLQTQNKNMLDKSILELTKYIAKDSNYLENEEVFLNFYQGLKGKRQYAYGGDFKLAREKLKNGELEEYYFKDETEWYWLIINKWNNNKYSEYKDIYLEEKDD